MRLHVRIVLRDAVEHLVPQHAGILEGVPLAHGGEAAPLATRELERVPDHTLGPLPREHRRLQGHLLRRAPVAELSDAGVLTLHALAHEDHVDVGRLHAGQRRGNPWQELHGPEVHVLVEPEPDREQQLAERDRVEHLRRADRAEQDRVVAAQRLQRVRRHHLARLEVMVRPPREVIELEGESLVPLRHEPQHLLRLGGDLGADSVAGDDGDAMRRHRPSAREAIASIKSSRPNSNCSSSLGNRYGAAATQFGNSCCESDPYALLHDV